MSAPANCREALPLLSAHLDGDLAPETAAAVERHLASCAACRAELGLLRLTVGALRELPELPPPAGILAGVRAGIRPVPWHVRVRSALAGRWWAQVPIGALATLVLVIGIALFQDRNPELKQKALAPAPPTELRENAPVPAGRPAAAPAPRLAAAPAAAPEEAKTSRSDAAPTGERGERQLAKVAASAEEKKDASARVQGAPRTSEGDLGRTRFADEVVAGRGNLTPPAAQPAPPAPQAAAAPPAAEPARREEAPPHDDRFAKGARSELAFAPAPPERAADKAPPRPPATFREAGLDKAGETPAPVVVAPQVEFARERRAEQDRKEAEAARLGAAKSLVAAKKEKAQAADRDEAQPADGTEVLFLFAEHDAEVEELRAIVKRQGGRLLEVRALDPAASQEAAAPVQRRLQVSQQIRQAWRIEAVVPNRNLEPLVAELQRRGAYQLLERQSTGLPERERAGEQGVRIHLFR